MKTVYAVFAVYEDARSAADDCIGLGLSEETMNVVVAAKAGREYLKGVRELDVSRGSDAKSRALGGQSLYGLDKLLAGQQAVSMADAGAVLAGGPLATTMIKPRTGQDSFLADALRELGVDRASARELVAALGRGKILLWVRCDERMAAPLRETFARWRAERVGLMR
jgi:hypothetical protein